MSISEPWDKTHRCMSPTAGTSAASSAEITGSARVTTLVPDAANNRRNPLSSGSSTISQTPTSRILDPLLPARDNHRLNQRTQFIRTPSTKPAPISRTGSRKTKAIPRSPTGMYTHDPISSFSLRLHATNYAQHQQVHRYDNREHHPHTRSYPPQTTIYQQPNRTLTANLPQRPLNLVKSALTELSHVRPLNPPSPGQ
jgi:hypothetical protein